MHGGVPFLALMSKAVDVGGGTGVATVQIEATFPSVKVYGLDISAVPEAVRKTVSANAAWALGIILHIDYGKAGDDVMSNEIFTPGGLDYVFGRIVVLGINATPAYCKTPRSLGTIESPVHLLVFQGTVRLQRVVSGRGVSRPIIKP